MALTTTIALAATAWLAASISAFTGVAGGVLLLSGLILVVPPMAVVPIHGAVQFCAGLSRMLVYRQAILWPLVATFIVAMIPGAVLGAVGLSYLNALNPSYVLLAIAAVIAFSMVKRPVTVEDGAAGRDISHLRLGGLGFVCGLLGMFVGSTGPLVSSWLLKNGIVKEAHIATKSVMQGTAHLAKVPLFIWALSFDYSRYGTVMLCMIAMVFIGTLCGRWALKRLDSAHFVTMTRILLGLIVVRIVITEIPKLA